MGTTTAGLPAGTQVLTVCELNVIAKDVLEQAFRTLWISGEVSNLSRPSSGHFYFCLKDAQAQVRAVVWRSSAQRLRFDLHDGMEVFARGRVTLYPARGEFQFVVEELIPKGIGALELAFRQLQEKLAQRGWFDSERKRPLPAIPRTIALVTSPSGAVVRDMLRIMLRRWPLVDVWIYPVPVQGDGAAGAIAQALNDLNAWRCADLIVLARGGGSLEDLWAFNEELVAAAIVASSIPVVSAIGHEVDFTIADFVADRRAATPSEAAELVVPDQEEIAGKLRDWHERLSGSLAQRLLLARERLESFATRRSFRDPGQRLREAAQALDEREERLRRAMKAHEDRSQQLLAAATGRLESLSPLNVLRRGYSLCRKADDAALIRSATAIRVGELLLTRLWHGEIASRVESIDPGPQQHERSNANGHDL